ncbi:MAG: hypothetical protein ABI175_27425, partial [Polyangiales bacterium]
MGAGVMLAGMLVGCGSKDDSQGTQAPPRVVVGHPKNAELPLDFVCPGAAACPASDDGALYAAVATKIITPDIPEKLTKSVSSKPWEYKPARGDTFDDANGNGKFDAVWIAGYGTGRAAAGKDSDQEVRTFVLKQGNTTIAFVTIDFIGFMYDELQRIREELAATGTKISYVVMNASHVHEAEDTLGIWGPDDATTGLNK